MKTTLLLLLPVSLLCACGSAGQADTGASEDLMVRKAEKPFPVGTYERVGSGAGNLVFSELAVSDDFRAVGVEDSDEGQIEWNGTYEVSHRTVRVLEGGLGDLHSVSITGD